MTAEQLQTYITQLQAVKLASKGVFDATTVSTYATAIEGLEAKQAALLLSTQGLTNAQIQQTLTAKGLTVEEQYQAMADAGLLARKQKLTAVQIQENLQTVLGAEADTSAAMASLGLSASIEGQEHQTVRLSAAKLQEAVNTNVLTEAQAQELAMRTGVTYAMQKQSASTLPKWIATLQAGTKAVWGQVKATAVWLATTPAGWATAAIAAIGGVIAGLNKYAKKAKEVSDKAQEAFDKSKERVQSNKEEAKSLDELIKKYEKLKSESDIDSGTRDEIKELQYDIVDLVGAEAKNLDLVNGKLDDELAKLKEISAEKSRQNVEDARDSYYQSRQAAEKLTGNDDNYGNDASISESEINKLLGISYNAAKGSSGKYVDGKWISVQWAEILDTFTEQFGDIVRDSKNPFSREIVIDTTEIDNIADRIKRLKELKDFLHDMGLHKSGFYSSVVDSISYYETQYSSEVSAANNLVNAVVSNLSIADDKLKGISVDSLESFEEYRNKIIDEAKSDEDIAEILSDGILSTDDIEKAVNNFMATAEGFSTWYEQWIGGINSETVNPPATFDQAWSNSFTSEIEAVKKLGDTLLDLAEKGRLTIDTFNEADSTGYFKKLGISAEEAVLKINKLVDESKQLSSMSNQVSKITEALATKRDDKFVDADTLSGFDAEIRGLDSWDRFQEVLGSTASSYKECEEAANALATEWVNSSDFLSQLTEQNKEYYATQLKAMGVENYEEILAYAQDLNAAKEALSQASFDLATATNEEIQELIEDGKYTELAQQQIWALILAKQAEEGITLDTSTDCLNLLALAKNAGITGEAVSMLTELIEIYDDMASGVYGTNFEVMSDAARKAEEIKKKIIGIMSNNADETVELKPRIKLSPKAKSAAKAAGKETGKSYLDGLKEELSKMNSIISYISKLLGKKITSYGNQKDDAVKALEAQKDAAKEALEAQKNAASEAAEAQKNALDSQKEGLESQKEAVQDQIDAKQKEIDKINEAAKARKNELDIQKAQYELMRMQNQKTKLVYSEGKGMHYVTDTSGIRDAKEKVTEAKENKVIASIEKEISAIEETIDAIDRQIDALDRQADALEEQASAASDYYDTLMDESDSYYDQLIADTESYWDSLINGLEEYQTRWEELADIEEEAKMNAALKELGITTEDVLNMSEEEFEKFKQRYLAVLTEMYAGDEAVLAALQEASGVSADSLQTLIKELQKTLEKTDEYSKSADNAETESSELSGELDNASASAGNASSSIDSVSTSASNAAMSIDRLKRSLSNIPSPEGFDAIAAAIERIKDAVDSVCRSVAAATGQMQNLQAFKDAVKIGEGVAAAFSSSGTTVGDSYASGTGLSGLEHDEKNALRSEYGQPELTVYPDGRTELTTSPVMSDLPKGTVVYNEEQTEKIMGSKPAPAGNAYSGGTGSTGGNVIITPGGLELRPLQPGDKMYDMVQKFNKYFDSIDRNIEKLVPNSVYEHNRKMDRIINQISNSSVVNNRNVQQPVTIEIGDIHLTGVQDVDGLAAAIKTRFPNNMMQEYYKN